MNLNEMQNAWNSPRNNLPTQERQRLAGQFIRQMIRRRRFRAIWLINTFGSVSELSSTCQEPSDAART